MTRSFLRRAGFAVTLTLICAAPLRAQAGAGPMFVNGVAQVVPAFADSTQWIRQNLWVETDSTPTATAATIACTWT